MAVSFFLHPASCFSEAATYSLSQLLGEKDEKGASKGDGPNNTSKVCNPTGWQLMISDALEQVDIQWEESSLDDNIDEADELKRQWISALPCLV